MSDGVVRDAGLAYGVFAIVLGLLAWIFLAALGVVVGVEINVVRAKRLYPRALLTPFTDDVDLTSADRRSYTDAAVAQRYKGFEQVVVSFDTPQRPDVGCDALDHTNDGPGTPPPATDLSTTDADHPEGDDSNLFGDRPQDQLTRNAQPVRGHRDPSARGRHVCCRGASTRGDANTRAAADIPGGMLDPGPQSSPPR